MKEVSIAVSAMLLFAFFPMSAPAQPAPEDDDGGAGEHAEGPDVEPHSPPDGARRFTSPTSSPPPDNVDVRRAGGADCRVDADCRSGVCLEHVCQGTWSPESSWLPVLPTVRIAASTEGSARLSAGFDALTPIAGTGWDLRVSPGVELQTGDGRATAFGARTDDDGGVSFSEARPWTGSLAFTLESRPEVEVTLAGLSADEERLLYNVYSIAAQMRCHRSCAGVQSQECNAIRGRELAAYHDPEDICDAGRDSFSSPASVDFGEAMAWFVGQGRSDARDLCTSLCATTEGQGPRATNCARFAETNGDELCVPRDHDELLESPPSRFAPPSAALSLGASFGRTRFRYVEPVAQGSTVLVEADETEWSGGVAIYGFALVGRTGPRDALAGPEGWIAFDRRWTPADDTAEVCSEPGMVDMDVARVCRQRHFGAPSATNMLNLTGGLTFVDGARLRWRSAINLELMLDLDGSASIGVLTPVSFDLTRFGESYQGKYKGVVRLMPRFRFAVRGDGYADFNIALLVEIRGTRALFPTGANLY